jgi:ABC-type glycerol-3-phosphate transport system substrate-binding protein
MQRQTQTELTRRRLLAATGAGLAGAMVGRAPHVKAQTSITIGVGNWAVDSMTEVLETLDFTGQTGIEVEVATRPGTPNEFITQMAGAIQAGNSPYDVIDFEDEIASTFSRAGWLLGLDDIIPADFYDDYPPQMVEMAELWDTYNGETFRIHHNYEANYWFYRKDIFDERGLEAPTTWEEVAALGEEFTDEAAGIWASGDGLAKGAFLNVYVAYITRQAGGDPFQTDEAYREGLQYIYDLMHGDQVLNPASLQKDYDAINQDYTADRIFFMRQWPFFYDVARAATDWYEEGKAEIALPPVGPAGIEGASYAAGWGFGIPRTAPNVDAAKELVSFLVDIENAGRMAQIDTWYLSARNSVLEVAGEDGIAPYLKMYSDAGAIATRPFHEKFVEAVAAVEDAASSYLSDQISLDDAVEQTRTRLEGL